MRDLQSFKREFEKKEGIKLNLTNSEIKENFEIEFSKIVKKILKESDAGKSSGRVQGLLEKTIIEEAEKVLKSNPVVLKDFLFKKVFKSYNKSYSKKDFNIKKDKYGLYDFPARYNEGYFDIAMKANSSIESGGQNFKAENEYGAYGYSQIMWANYINWSKEYSGIDVYEQLSEKDAIDLKRYSRLKDRYHYYDLINYRGTNINKKALNILKKTNILSPNNQIKLTESKFKEYFDITGDYALTVASWYCGLKRSIPDALKCKARKPYPNAKEHMNKFLLEFSKLGEKGGFDRGEGIEFVSEDEDSSVVVVGGIDISLKIKKVAMEKIIKLANYYDLNNETELSSMADYIIDKLNSSIR